MCLLQVFRTDMCDNTSACLHRVHQEEVMHICVLALCSIDQESLSGSGPYTLRGSLKSLSVLH
jgi:hypothetical protein